MKAYYQALGYERGDVLIKEVGQHLLKIEMEFVARLGGNDFVIVSSLGKQGRFSNLYLTLQIG